MIILKLTKHFNAIEFFSSSSSTDKKTYQMPISLSITILMASALFLIGRRDYHFCNIFPFREFVNIHQAQQSINIA